MDTKIEFGVCSLDELSLGFHLQYGEDEDGSFHMLTIGFLLFWITIQRYK